MLGKYHSHLDLTGEKILSFGRLPQLRQLVPDPGLVDDRGFDAGYRGPVGKIVEHQILQVLSRTIGEPL